MTPNLYKTNEIMTASPEMLVIKLYEGAVRFLKLAILDIEKGNYESKSNHINKAIDILIELNVVLDTENGGEVSLNLRSLYLFCIKHLKVADSDLDTSKISQVTNILEELLSGWRSIAA